MTRLIDWRNAVYAVDGRVLSWRAKAVAGAVSIHADGNGRKIRPSVDRLAAETGLASRTVDTALRELRKPASSSSRNRAGDGTVRALTGPPSLHLRRRHAPFLLPKRHTGYGESGRKLCTWRKKRRTR